MTETVTRAMRPRLNLLPLQAQGWLSTNQPDPESPAQALVSAKSKRPPTEAASFADGPEPVSPPTVADPPMALAVGECYCETV
jgi:hypothetical protein